MPQPRLVPQLMPMLLLQLKPMPALERRLEHQLEPVPAPMPMPLLELVPQLELELVLVLEPKLKLVPKLEPLPGPELQLKLIAQPMPVPTLTNQPMVPPAGQLQPIEPLQPGQHLPMASPIAEPELLPAHLELSKQLPLHLKAFDWSGRVVLDSNLGCMLLHRDMIPNSLRGFLHRFVDSVYF